MALLSLSVASTLLWLTDLCNHSPTCLHIVVLNQLGTEVIFSLLDFTALLLGLGLLFSFPNPIHRPHLWSSGQSSLPHIQRPGFDSRPYQICWEVVGLERGPLSLVSTTEELLGRKSSDSGLQIREYGRRDPLHWSSGTDRAIAVYRRN
jgi:hypothetical protein